MIPSISYKDLLEMERKRRQKGEPNPDAQPKWGPDDIGVVPGTPEYDRILEGRRMLERLAAMQGGGQSAAERTITSRPQAVSAVAQAPVPQGVESPEEDRQYGIGRTNMGQAGMIQANLQAIKDMELLPGATLEDAMAARNDEGINQTIKGGMRDKLARAKALRMHGGSPMTAYREQQRAKYDARLAEANKMPDPAGLARRRNIPEKSKYIRRMRALAGAESTRRGSVREEDARTMQPKRRPDAGMLARDLQKLRLRHMGLDNVGKPGKRRRDEGVPYFIRGDF